MKNLIAAAALTALLAVWPAAHAQEHSAHAGHAGNDAQMNAEMTRGEIRKWDAKLGKVTLRHEEIKSLMMAPMTMVFTVRNPEQMQGLNVGDTVLFDVEQENGKLVVTRIRKP